MVRHSLFALLFAGMVFGCSSSNANNQGTVTDEDTGVEEDTAPVEDTAPWLTYPAGPYGLAKGNTFPNLKFKGYKDATGDWTDMSMGDYYDPTGERGFTGIYFVIGAQWCPPCNQEADFLPVWWSKDYKDRGAKIVTAIIQNSTHAAATQTTVDQWRTKHKINFDIMLDGESTALPTTGSVGLPYNYIINPRNMQVIRIIQGVDPGVVTKCTSNDVCCPTDGSGPCYKCSGSLGSCLSTTMKGPIVGLDALMVANGAKPFDTALMP